MTTRHKALLIGASDYDEPGIRSLPFVRDDLARLSAALTERGFHSAEVAESKRGITFNFVNEQVSRFLREAKRDDTLWILLSGHGQHYEGTDHLIPEDASFHVHPFASSCVPIDWSKELNETAAPRVVFLIDACREGIEQDSMGPAGIEGWSRRKREAAQDRKVAYVYACSPGQFALFVQEGETVRDGTDVGTSPGESFSLFSRAVCDVVTGLPHAMHLTEFEEAVQRRIAELHTAYRKSRPLQLIRVRTDAEKQGFLVLPGPVRDAREHPWVRAVAGYPAWERTDPELCAARDTLKDFSVSLAAHLSVAYETAAGSLREDPWHDGELAKRTHDRLGFLLRLAENTRLSPTEAALVSLLPFISQAFWAQEAARRITAISSYDRDRTPEGDSFHAFSQRYPRLDRRLRRLRQTGSTDDSARQILWWLYHRWLLQQPDVYAPQSLKELLSPLAAGSEHPSWLSETLSSERVIRFIKDQRTTPFATPLPGDLADHEPIAESTMHEHAVREVLVSCLAKAAHALAIDPVDLPEAVAEHLGISDSVNLVDLLATLRESKWRTSGAGRALTAVCQHPAVEISLQEHAHRVDSLLRDINQSAAKASHSLAPLATLPPYANSGGIRPSGNTPANLSSGIRFHLAEDRVQELLMGEELYGDRGLAVRELYQNALDACRYREARTTYLRRTGQRVEEWEGLIEFVQGVDDAGRPYLECRDNGIGMGVNELSRTFSQGGARFVDLPEYVEEAADWAELDPPVELFPNSRFGIGVLSYFMLADEISVHTCRLDRAGRPGRLLKVTIAGPGNLFRIEDEGPGTQAGTRVRLHLTARAARRSALDQLADVLWVAQYRTRAVHGARTQEWDPGVLRADLAAAYGGQPHSRNYPLGRIFASSDPDLWWVEDGGMVLADGLLAADGDRISSSVPGVIVNMHSRYRPALSVDRRHIRAYDIRRVQEMMRGALASLFGEARSALSYHWLSEVSLRLLAFADEVTEQAGRAGATYRVSSRELPYATVGFFPPDVLLLPVVAGDYTNEPTDSYTRARIGRRASLIRQIPAPVLRWRLLALYAAGIGDELGPGFPGELCLPSARPSDMCLLSLGSRGMRYWDNALNNELPTLSHTLVGRTGLPAFDRLFPWRPVSTEVTSAEVFSCVAATRYSASQVVARLSQLGYRTASVADVPDATARDVRLLRPLGDPGGWLTPGAVLSLPQISYSAARAGLSPADAAERLRRLGYRVPDQTYASVAWPPEDAQLLRSLWGTKSERVPAAKAEEISTARVVTTAFALSRPVTAVVRVLTEAGFSVSATAEQLDTSHDDDSVILSDGLPVDRMVPRGQLASLALHLGRAVPDVAERLSQLGFQVPDPLPGPEFMTRANAELTGRDARSRDWPAEDEPVDVFTLAQLSDSQTESLPRLAELLTTLGYDVAAETALVESLTPGDIRSLRTHTLAGARSALPIPAEHLYAAAQLTGLTTEQITDGLTRLGLDVEPIPEDLAADIAIGEELDAVLGSNAPTRATPPAHHANPARRISLPALASVAMRNRVSFREAAQVATGLGMSHEAEDWFG